MTRFTFRFGFVIFLLLSQSANATKWAQDGEAASPLTIELGAPFCENMVLQRGMEVPVWGWSEPGTEITVEFAGQKQTATAGVDHQWQVKLAPLTASFDPAQMVITESTGARAVIGNILVGEVWMASGQSNMQWKVEKRSL